MSCLETVEGYDVVVLVCVEIWFRVQGQIARQQRIHALTENAHCPWLNNLQKIGGPLNPKS